MLYRVARRSRAFLPTMLFRRSRERTCSVPEFALWESLRLDTVSPPRTSSVRFHSTSLGGLQATDAVLFVLLRQSLPTRTRSSPSLVGHWTLGARPDHLPPQTRQRCSRPTSLTCLLTPRGSFPTHTRCVCFLVLPLREPADPLYSPSAPCSTGPRRQVDLLEPSPPGVDVHRPRLGT